MIAKIFVLLLAGCAFVQASPVPADVTDQLQNVPQQSLQFVQQAVGEVANRLGNAYVSTYDQQETSVQGTLNSVKDMGQKTVETGVNLLKNGLEFFFIIPRFGRNALARS